MCKKAVMTDELWHLLHFSGDRYADMPKHTEFWSWKAVSVTPGQEGLSPEEAPHFVHLDPHKLFEFGFPNLPMTTS